YTLVADFSRVRDEERSQVFGGGHLVFPDQVAGLLVIILHRTAQTSFQQGEVQSYVEHGGAFPFQIRIGILGWADGSDEVAIVIKGPHVAESHPCDQRVEAQGISGNPVAGAETEVFQQSALLQSAEVAEFVHGRNAWKGAPSVVGPEGGRAIPSQRALEIE